jgi:hypothetical protein
LAPTKEQDGAKPTESDQAQPIKSIINFIWHIQLAALAVVLLLWLLGIW